MQEPKLTGHQIRAARGALNWSVQELAMRCGVGSATIVRYEMISGIPKSRKGNLRAIMNALETAGIEFTVSADNVPGILIHTRG